MLKKDFSSFSFSRKSRIDNAPSRSNGQSILLRIGR
jgi:hypothetical protein